MRMGAADVRRFYTNNGVQGEYSATNVIPPVGAVAAVKMLPYQIYQFLSLIHI